MMELDIATQQALQKKKNGLSIELRQDVDEEFKTIPDYFDRWDVRKPAALYVEEALRSILQDLFDIRRKLEKTFSRRELLAYDRILYKHLAFEKLMPRLE